MIKKGDTLVEVTLAIGIFSMIAIAVVSVMSTSTSNAQASLEATLAREAVDVQAEALRFLQAAYINSAGADDKYAQLWREITKQTNVNELSKEHTNENASIVQFNPTSCAELYESGVLAGLNAFVLDANRIGDFTETSDVYISAKAQPAKFAQATAYPRLIYPIADELNADIRARVSLKSAQGIFIVPVKDPGKTRIIVKKGGTVTEAAFYDFYIRTCWYSTDAEIPTIISTVIRLYNPNAVKVEE